MRYQRSTRCYSNVVCIMNESGKTMILEPIWLFPPGSLYVY